MKVLSKFLLFVVSCLWVTMVVAVPDGSLLPENLQCELRKNPVGVDAFNPDLSYILRAVNSNARGLRQTAYQVIVSSSLARLQQNNGDLWNPGKLMSDKMAYIKYTGKPLHSTQQCWWKVRVWDNNNTVSEWSQAATWTMGVLREEDWDAAWVSAKDADKFARTPFGYRSMVADSQKVTKWVQVDLGSNTPIDNISLLPVFFEDRAGYGFPPNFKIEIGGDENFANSTMVADLTTRDYANPGWKSAIFPVSASGRYVRITVNKLWGRGRRFQLALRQIAVLSNGKNIASGKKVTALDANDTEGWSVQNLTDMPVDMAALPNFSSMLLRKDFSTTKRPVRAVIHVSGMSAYELTINGIKAGNSLLTPGWTDYRKTVLYDSYDLTELMKTGSNAIGILLGNGMYNIQPDSVRYVKFLNSFGPLKAIARLQIEYADGTKSIVSTDATWQVAPGPVTYSNMFGGEDYDANLAMDGWNKPFFKVGNTWEPAFVTTGPGGILKGLSYAAPPVKVIQVIKPVKVSKIKDNIWIYDCGQNASMMPLLSIVGPKSSYVRIIPAELLGTDGYVDRRSATQDGVRPAWWQYTLAGNGVEQWKPAFFYQGARYLQVELYAANSKGPLPQVKMLEDQVVHSSSTPVGRFSTSNELFNRIYELVRWAQRSNMMSLMTDCPHREKMGWLEENHLNGPALRYNFDLALLFRKTMNDMADAQLENGFVPNIAPEYFTAGSLELTNAMRNSVEWGSSFIIVPWQQYLFSGDISLLNQYYDKMKKYVAFLASTAQNDIITIGLGDWYDIGPNAPGRSQLTPAALTGTAVYYYDTWILSQVAGILDKQEDAAFFKQAADRIRDSFNKSFYNRETGQYATGSQTGNAISLYCNLAEPQHRQQVVDGIVGDVRKRGNGLTAGDVGYRFLLRALAEAGRSDVIYDMNNQSEKPGYGYQLKMGATSLTEKWDAGVGDFGSQNHFMLGQINEWFFNDLVGISSDQKEVGFKKIIFKPAVVGDLKWVKGSFNSISGMVAAEWKRAGERFELNISVPPNTSALVYLPAKDNTGVTENGNRILGNKEIQFIKNENGCSVYEVLSGNYKFASTISR